MGSFEKFPRAGAVRHCRAEDLGLRKKKLKLLDAANSGFSVDTSFERTVLVSYLARDGFSFSRNHEVMKSASL